VLTAAPKSVDICRLVHDTSRCTPLNLSCQRCYEWGSVGSHSPKNRNEEISLVSGFVYRNYVTNYGQRRIFSILCRARQYRCYSGLLTLLVGARLLEKSAIVPRSCGQLRVLYRILYLMNGPIYTQVHSR